MIGFSYTIKDKTGIHARPAGFISKIARESKSEVVIEKDGKRVNAVKLMMLMGLGVKCGDRISVEVSGSDEQETFDRLKAFFEENL